MVKFCTRLFFVLFCTLIFTQGVWGQTHFTFSATEDYYSIIVNTATIDGQVLQNGDEIGVFFTNGGALVCAGAVVWPNKGISAWGDDSQTPAKDGFAAGETLVFKIWDASTATEYDNVNATFPTGNGTWGNGAYAIVNLNAIPDSPAAPEIDVQDNVHAFDYSLVNIGSSSAHTFVIQNEGDAVLNISSVALSGTNAADFSITSGGGASTVAAGGDRDLVITFTPSVTGGRAATLTINSNDADESSWQIALTGTGEEADQTHFTFTATEDYYSIIVNTATIDGQVLQDGDEIGVFFDNGGVLECAGAVVWPNKGISAWGDDSQTPAKDGFAAGEILVFKIWDASAAAEYSDVNAAFTTGNGTWGNGAYAQVNLNAIPYIPEPEIDVQDNIHSFDYSLVNVGSSSAHTFVIQNEGDAVLNITSIAISGTNAADFSITGGGASTIAAGGTRDLVVTFTPSATGGRAATLTINSNDADESSWQIALTGTGAGQAHFAFTVTEDYYSIVVNEAGINSQTLQDGDEIGVFFDNGGVLVCAGAVVWPSQGISAWGDDSQTPAKDGFAAGEALIFKIWSAGAATEYGNVNATFLVGNGTWGNGAFAQVSLNAIPNDIHSIKNTIPLQYDLQQNFPNPFNPQTNIIFSLPEITDVRAEVYNVMGQKIKTLVNEKMLPGSYHLAWNGTDDNQEAVSAGIYYLRVTAGNFSQTVKMAFIK